MKGYVVCVYKNISNEGKLKEYAIVEQLKNIKEFLIRAGDQHRMKVY